MFEIFVDPAARDPSTEFPLDGRSFDISSIPQDTLVAYGETAPVIHSSGESKVVRLSRDLVLKCGTAVLASEGETMKYVKDNFPGVRLPSVHRYFNVDYSCSYFGVKGYIVMDYVDGLSLDKCWDQLDDEARKNIVDQVGAMAGELQSMHSGDPGVIGGGTSRGILFSDYGAGPFKTREMFEKWMNWKLALSQYFGHAPLDVPPIECPYFVLTHGDISPRNLIMDANDQVWVIDWGCAGFYPRIFEAAVVKRGRDFPSFADLLLPLLYNDPGEMVQLESCNFGIHRLVFSVPPGMKSGFEPKA